MTELVTIKDMPKELKILLLKKIGYGSDGNIVLKKNGNAHLDRYTNEEIKLDNMFIYPGSTIIIDNNPVSLAAFFEEFGDVI